MASDPRARSARRAQVARFLVAGVVNTGFGLAVYSGAIFLGCADWAALMIGLVSGVAFNFFSLGRYAFRDASLRRLPRFVCGYGVIYLVNLVALEWLRGFVRSPVLCQVLLAPPMAVLSYFLLSRLVFRLPAVG